jgi:hypothetical protein
MQPLSIFCVTLLGLSYKLLFWNDRDATLGMFIIVIFMSFCFTHLTSPEGTLKISEDFKQEFMNEDSLSMFTSLKDYTLKVSNMFLFYLRKNF